jgi:uncharacterized protein (TIRG00374 family)
LNRWSWFGIQVLAGALMLALLLYFADLGSVVTLVFQADRGYVLMAALAFIVASVFVGYSLFILLERMGYSPSAFKTVMVSIAGQLISDLTPARTGYFVTPALLGGELGVNFEDGMAAIVFTGAVQSFASVILGGIAIIYFSSYIGSGAELIALFAFGLLPVALMGVALVSVIHHTWLSKLIEYARNVPFIKPRIEQVRRAIAAFQKSGRRATGAAVQVAFFLLVAQVLNSVALYLLALSIGVLQVSPFGFVMTYAIAGFSMYAFVTVAGLGVQESMYALLLGLMGVVLDKATAIAVLARFFFTITDFIGIPYLARLGVRSIPGLLTSGSYTDKQTESKASK